MRIFAFLLFVIMFGCTKSQNVNLTDAQILQNAQEDYDLVVSGKKPKNAIEDNTQGVPADGGTRYFKGQGYKLEVRQTIADEAEPGFNYGPVITFEKIIENGKPKQMSNIKFYKTEDLLKLLGE